MAEKSIHELCAPFNRFLQAQSFPRQVGRYIEIQQGLCLGIIAPGAINVHADLTGNVVISFTRRQRGVQFSRVGLNESPSRAPLGDPGLP